MDAIKKKMQAMKVEIKSYYWTTGLEIQFIDKEYCWWGQIETCTSASLKLGIGRFLAKFWLSTDIDSHLILFMIEVWVCGGGTKRKCP